MNRIDEERTSAGRASGPLAKQALSPPPRAGRGRRQTILIVDDEPEVCRLIQRVLRQERYQVLYATSGKSALAELGSRCVDLVILDIRMPEMSGIQVLEELRRRHKDLPVLMLTAHGHLDTARQAMQLGAYDYITKPFSIDLVKKIVHEALEQSSEQE